MPLTAPRNRAFDGGTVGQPITLPSGVTAGGAAPNYIAGNSGTAARFSGVDVVSYYQDLWTASSDFNQFTGEFRLAALPTGGNADILALRASPGLSASLVILTSGSTLLRDGGSASTITGWTNVTLAANVWYRIRIATQKGSTTANGAIKAELIRVSDNVVLASGVGSASNTTVNQSTGVDYGKRSATGTLTIDWDNVRLSDQGFDYLALPIPTTGAAETFTTGATALGLIGDSTTDRSGLGTGPDGTVEAAIVGNGQGWTNARVRVNGLTSRTINYDNGVHPTGVEQIAAWRTEGFDPGTWAFALGGNGGASDQAQQQAWIMDLLNAVAAGPQSSYRVVIYGFARQSPTDADAARFWTALQAVTPPSKVTLTRVNYNNLIHFTSGTTARDETGLWQTTSATEAHMTSAGYTLRDQLMVPYLTAPPTTGGGGTTPTTPMPTNAETGLASQIVEALFVIGFDIADLKNRVKALEN